MTDWLYRVLPPRWATVALVLWYTTLIVLVVLCSSIGQGDFFYGHI
jgi:hypothetical protein